MNPINPWWLLLIVPGAGSLGAFTMALLQSGKVSDLYAEIERLRRGADVEPEPPKTELDQHMWSELSGRMM